MRERAAIGPAHGVNGDSPAPRAGQSPLARESGPRGTRGQREATKGFPAPADSAGGSPAAIALLRAAPGTVEQDLAGYDEDDVSFDVHGLAARHAVAPAAERGVVWELCEEDREDPPRLGEVTVSAGDAHLILSAPIRGCADRLPRALPWELQGMLGPMDDEDLDAPDVLPRVSRDRPQRFAATTA